MKFFIADAPIHNSYYASKKSLEAEFYIEVCSDELHVSQS